MTSQHCRGHDSKKQQCEVKEKEGLKHGGIRWLRYAGAEGRIREKPFPKAKNNMKVPVLIREAEAGS